MLYLPLQHHSTTDWDFSAATWQLSTAQFISPPSSLRAVSGVMNILSKLEAAYCVPAGRKVSYIRQHGGSYNNGFIFRVQRPSGSAWVMSRYVVWQTAINRWGFGRYVNTTFTTLGEWVILVPIDTWHRFRVTWWTGEDEEGHPALCVKLEREEDSIWVDYGNRYDTANMWADSQVNRLGICLYATDSFFDDTEIWIPA